MIAADSRQLEAARETVLKHQNVNPLGRVADLRADIKKLEGVLAKMRNPRARSVFTEMIGALECAADTIEESWK